MGRGTLSAGLVLLAMTFYTPANAWAPETRVRMTESAVRLLPASLRLALESHREALLRGALEPMTREDDPDHRPPWSSGTLDERFVREVDGLIQSLANPQSFERIAGKFGAVAHFVADAGFPPGMSDGDGSDRYAHFAAFCESRREKFPWVFYGHDDPDLEQRDYGAWSRNPPRSTTVRSRSRSDRSRTREASRTSYASGWPSGPKPAATRDARLTNIQNPVAINVTDTDPPRRPGKMDTAGTNRIRRALISVFEKDGVVELGRQLADLEIEIVSSGGTATLLEKNGIAVTRVADYTGFPEMLDGRVKTLHPAIHAGILAIRSNEQHMQDLEKAGLKPIDLVVVNLYPFQKTAATEGIGLDEVVEMIDIGGPTMVRAAAKNFAHVGVVVNPDDYSVIADEIKSTSGLSLATRRRLSVEAFRHTSRYDSAVHSYLSGVSDESSEAAEKSPFGDRLQIDFSKVQEMRYGENPHQRAAFYRDPLDDGPGVANARQLQGKALSFNNILDFDAALGLAAEFPRRCCVIVKHGNPCGTALGGDLREAFDKARACDPTSSFGGVVAFNRKVDRTTAEAIAEIFFEGVIAPEFDPEAREILAKKKRLRLLEVGSLERYVRTGFDLRRVNGGLLAQDWDLITEKVRECPVVTQRKPTEDEWRALEFAWTIVKHVKSNAIIYTGPDRTLGIGAGQMSRVDSARLAVQKAENPLEGAAMASDAFFPFRDGLDVPAEAGITAVIQPGGSIRDKEVIEAANEHGMAMVFSGRRHFRH